VIFDVVGQLALKIASHLSLTQCRIGKHEDWL